MANLKKTTSKTAAANKKAAKTQPRKTYKTSTGAQQFGDREAIVKQRVAALKKYLKNPTVKNEAILESLKAASYASVSNILQSDPAAKKLFDNQEAKTKKKVRSILSKAK
jgi:hypothetical protein